MFLSRLSVFVTCLLVLTSNQALAWEYGSAALISSSDSAVYQIVDGNTRPVGLEVDQLESLSPIPHYFYEDSDEIADADFFDNSFQMLATGYSSTVDQCDADPFITASGSHVHWGTLACPKQYSFGTRIKIEGLGEFVCEDRGGAIKGNHFDIWFESRAEALKWGKRKVLAEIVE